MLREATEQVMESCLISSFFSCFGDPVPSHRNFSRLPQLLGLVCRRCHHGGEGDSLQLLAALLTKHTQPHRVTPSALLSPLLQAHQRPPRSRPYSASWPPPRCSPLRQMEAMDPGSCRAFRIELCRPVSEATSMVWIPPEGASGSVARQRNRGHLRFKGHRPHPLMVIILSPPSLRHHPYPCPMCTPSIPDCNRPAPPQPARHRHASLLIPIGG
jgi:hypothetical protein